MSQEPHKIDKKIVAQRVIMPEETQSVDTVLEEFQPTLMNESIKRPEVLHGSTYKIKIGTMENALYLTINDIILNEDTEHQERRPYEVFINSKEMNDFQWIVALTRLASSVFRKGGDVTFLVDELKQVFDPQGGMWDKGIRYPSLVAKIGYTIERHLKVIGMIQTEELSDHQKQYLEDKRKEFESKTNDGESAQSEYPAGARLCPKCNTKAVVRLDNCDTCLCCSDSKCG